MQFLKTLAWVVVAVLLFYLGMQNWTEVDLNLWGDIVISIKLPVLLLAVFLLGFVPTWLVYRARHWALRRRLEPLERQRMTAATPVNLAEPVAEADPIP